MKPKLGAAEHNKFVDYIIPKLRSELSFDEAVKSLMELYCPKTSLFHKRWKCINLTRKEGQDYTTFASVVNSHCDDLVGGDIVFLIFNFHFVVVYLICFYMWLRVLRSRKVTIYSNVDNVIIIVIIIIGFWFKV